METKKTTGRGKQTCLFFGPHKFVPFSQLPKSFLFNQLNHNHGLWQETKDGIREELKRRGEIREFEDMISRRDDFFQSEMETELEQKSVEKPEEKITPLNSGTLSEKLRMIGQIFIEIADEI